MNPALDAASESQGTLFEFAEIEGFGKLSLRERTFCEQIVLGQSQRAAARAAGVEGDNAAVDVTACRLAQKPEVRRFLGQCWSRSGASIETTLAQACRVQARALNDYEEATNKEARAAAFKEWQAASTLVASIHGRLSIRIDGQVNHAHQHSGAVGIGVTTIPPQMLETLAQIRRSVVSERMAEKIPSVAA